MFLTAIAPRYTRVPTGQTASAIAGGSSIRVHGVIVTASGGTGTFSLLENDGTTVITTLIVPTNSSWELKTGFLADKGLKVTTDGSTTCTVFHSQPSA